MFTKKMMKTNSPKNRGVFVKRDLAIVSSAYRVASFVLGLESKLVACRSPHGRQGPESGRQWELRPYSRPPMGVMGPYFP